MTAPFASSNTIRIRNVGESASQSMKDGFNFKIVFVGTPGTGVTRLVYAVSVKKVSFTKKNTAVYFYHIKEVYFLLNLDQS